MLLIDILFILSFNWGDNEIYHGDVEFVTVMIHILQKVSTNT